MDCGWLCDMIVKKCHSKNLCLQSSKEGCVEEVWSGVCRKQFDLDLAKGAIGCVLWVNLWRDCEKNYIKNPWNLHVGKGECAEESRFYMTFLNLA